MTIKAVLFDLDGTLADTLTAIAGAVNLGLRQLGHAEHPVDAYRQMVGEGAAILCERALPEGRASDREPLLAAVRTIYAKDPLRRVRVYEGVLELVRSLRERGVHLGVISNKPHDLTVRTVEGLDLDGYFGCVLGQQDEIPRKPDPAGALWILEKLGVPPAEAMLVGDTPIDVRTAQAAGLTSVAVSWGFRGAAELLRAGPDHLASRPGQILELYDRLCP